MLRKMSCPSAGLAKSVAVGRAVEVYTRCTCDYHCKTKEVIIVTVNYEQQVIIMKKDKTI